VDALSVEAQRGGLSLQWLGPKNTQWLHRVVPQGGGADLLQAWAGQTLRSSSTKQAMPLGYGGIELFALTHPWTNAM
jgi:hypothetical protein